MTNQSLKYYSPKELAKITEEAERLRQKFPYSESDIRGTLDDLRIEKPYQENALTKYGKKKENKISKIKELKNKNLESEIIKEDLKNLGAVITSPIFALTSHRRLHKLDNGLPLAATGWGWVSLFIYWGLAAIVPESIPYIAGLQIGANFGSGIYEYIRYVKNKANERVENKKNSLEEISESD